MCVRRELKQNNLENVLGLLLEQEREREMIKCQHFRIVHHF